MMGTGPTAFLLLLTLALAAGVSAQAQTHPLTAMPAAAPGVEIQSWFPDHGRLEFPVGEKVDVVLSFHNGGDEALTVAGITGSINSPAAFNIYVNNLTSMAYDVVVPPRDEASLQYSFTPNKAIVPREFLVALTAFYTNPTGQTFSTTFFNKTSNIVETPTWVDFELLGLYGGFLVALAGIGYLIFKWLSGFSWFRAQIRKRPSKAPVAPAAPVELAENEWLKGTFYKGQQQARPRGKA